MIFMLLKICMLRKMKEIRYFSVQIRDSGFLMKLSKFKWKKRTVNAIKSCMIIWNKEMTFANFSLLHSRTSWIIHQAFNLKTMIYIRLGRHFYLIDQFIKLDFEKCAIIFHIFHLSLTTFLCLSLCCSSLK